MYLQWKNLALGDFPGSLVDKNLPCNAGDTGLISAQGRSPCVMKQQAHVLSCTTVKDPESRNEDPTQPNE